MIRLILVLSLVAMNARGDDEEMRRVMHVQTEAISDLTARVQALERRLDVTVSVQKASLDNVRQIAKTLQREIDVLLARKAGK
jgi:hypothetical protein